MNMALWVDTLIPMMRPERDYQFIESVPMPRRLVVEIDEIPADVAGEIRRESPNTSTVSVGLFRRRGQLFLSYQPKAGSPDGFPFCCREVDFLALHMGKPVIAATIELPPPPPVIRVAMVVCKPTPKAKPLSKAQRKRIARATKVNRD